MDLHVILGNQLYELKYLKKMQGEFFMCEDWDLCRHFKPHQAKIYFFLTAMREYRDYLSAQRKLHYYELIPEPQFFEKLEKTARKIKSKKIVMFEIEDKFFEKKMNEFVKKNNWEIEYLRTPNFICSRDEFFEYLDGAKKPFMKTFYEQQRQKHNILMDGDKPLGGKWSFDSENRKKIPKKFAVIDKMPARNSSPHREDVLSIIEKHFSSHNGQAKDFYFPTNHKEAKKALKLFFEQKLDKFGDFEDAIDDRHPFLYHTLFSPLINIGLLQPMDVVKEVQKRINKGNLNAVEGLVRQVMGWREFMRGIYHHFDEKQQKENFFKHKNKLSKSWYTGETGIPVVDKTIKKVQKYGYCHHIERLMVLSNLMLILKIHPQEVHRYFMEMFVDSLDWVMGPNVFGMGQFSDGGVFATKPYFS